MINFVICDDNQHMVDRLSNLFETAFIKGNFDAKIILKTTDSKKLLDFIANNPVDVVILDIQFNNSNMSGLDIAKQIRILNKNCYIIFSTSHYEYILQAYKFKTFDYLIKNTITVDILIDTLTRLFYDISGQTTNYVKIDNKGTIIEYNSILYIERTAVKITYHTLTGNYEAYSSFNKIEPNLPSNFVRCHKSYIANINNISSVKISSNTIIFKDNSSCCIGPKYKQKFLEVLNYDSFSK